MKTFLILSVFLSAAVAAPAAAPAQVADCIYYETTIVLGAGIARGGTIFAIVLKRDGTFSGLFQSTTSFFEANVLSSQADGTYTYEKIDEQTAMLSLFTIPQNFSGSVTRTLKFSSDNNGTIPFAPGDFTTSSHSFRLASLGARPPLVNCSNRSFIRAGGTAFTGFVLANGGSGLALVRVVGPGLKSFGINDAISNPVLNVVSAATNSVVAANDDWGSDPNRPTSTRADAITRLNTAVGAFALEANSRDSALLVSLQAGAYIAQATAANPDESGQVLIEVYMLP